MQHDPQRLTDRIVTIAQGAAKSGGILTAGAPLCGIFVPAGFEGATIAFEAAPMISETDRTEPPAGSAAWVPVRDAYGAVMALQVTAGSLSSFYRDALRGALWLRLVAPTNQAAARALTAVFGA